RGLECLAAPVAPPLPPTGPLAPAFLGLLPTRSCNLACRYCGFGRSGADQRHMRLDTAAAALEWYFGLLTHAGRARVGSADRPASVHFFGGEPFVAAEVVDFVVPYARRLAAERGMLVQFEAATNGVYPARRAEWVADHIDTVMLSLDGPEDIHDWHRPDHDGGGSFERVMASARILSAGPTDLCLRACVTGDTATRMEQTAAWFCDELRPGAVCFETLQPTEDSARAGLLPPDPWQFAAGFLRAAQLLRRQGVRPVYATADIGARQVSFCCPASDVPVISPDGSIAACYLLERDWQAAGLDLSLGLVRPDGGVTVEREAVERARALNVLARPGCARCFCRWHCAGGCHVNHPPTATYDRLCIQTRVIALGHLLDSLGRSDLAADLLDRTAALEQAVLQPSDRLLDLVGI
ncbi:MAG: radical SAM protein, partial [Anaerolineae bacterium]